MISCIMVDWDFLHTLGIKLIEGRGFSRQFPGDVENAYILNESAVREFGWTSALGKDFKIGNREIGTVIGVVEDFHFESFHQEIKPMVMFIFPGSFSSIYVRISPGNPSHILHFLKSKWQELIPGQSFEYSFIEDDLAGLYQTEMRLGKVFIIVTFLAIFIACLGLYGLSAVMLAQRNKEIGIRKALGASVSGIVLLLAKEFALWVLMSNIAAWPTAWYVMSKWLKNFAYRVPILPWTFLLAGLLALFIVLSTVSYRALRSASVNPIEVLRYE